VESGAPIVQSGFRKYRPFNTAHQADSQVGALHSNNSCSLAYHHQ